MPLITAIDEMLLTDQVFTLAHFSLVSIAPQKKI
jgi:hypothetical protein